MYILYISDNAGGNGVAVGLWVVFFATAWSSTATERYLHVVQPLIYMYTTVDNWPQSPQLLTVALAPYIATA